MKLDKLKQSTHSPAVGIAVHRVHHHNANKDTS